jgi:hypothetical protein
VANVRQTIGDYLQEEAPPFALWTDLLGILFEDNPNRPRLERVGATARVVYLVRMFSGQIANGGFHQFLANTSGDYAAETLEALQQAGATISAGLLEEALSLFPDRRAPRDQSERLRLLLGVTACSKDLLDRLDRCSYREVDPIEGESRESLDVLLLAYMQARAAEAVVAEPGAAPERPRN